MTIKAQNLTISIPNKGCDKNCPYCISRMTTAQDTNFDLMLRNVKKVCTLARAAEVQSVLFTGKGEPMLNYDNICALSPYFKDWPMEIQTNGLMLATSYENILIERLFEWGFDIIAVSVDQDSLFNFFEEKDLFKRIKKNGMNSRITVNVTKDLDRYSNFENLIDYCKKNQVAQLTIRKIVAPDNYHNSEVAAWIQANTSDEQYKQLIYQAIAAMRDAKPIRRLNHGMIIYDYKDVSFTHSDYCIQEESQETDTRSLIFQENGHLYTHWNSEASILF